MFIFCLVFAVPLSSSVYVYLAVTCWERADLLPFVCGVLLRVCHFPIGILDQVWYLIVSIPDLCTLTYFAHSTFNLYALYIKVAHNTKQFRRLVLEIFITHIFLLPVENTFYGLRPWVWSLQNTSSPCASKPFPYKV